MRTLVAAVVLSVAAPALAAEPLTWGERNQGEVSAMGVWSMGMPLGPTLEFAPRYSFIGFDGEIMFHLLPMISVGVTSGYHLFWGEKRDTIEIDNAALTGTQFRYVDTVPIFATGRYYLDFASDLSGFAGLGIGTVYVNRLIHVGNIIGFSSDSWRFGLAPQIGAILHTPGPDALIDVEFGYATPGGDDPSEMWLSFELGAFFD